MHKVLKVAALPVSALIFSAVVSCSVNDMGLRHDDMLEVGGREVPVSAYEAGMVRVLITEDLASRLEIRTDSAGCLLSSGVKSVDEAVASLGITSMKRTFPYAGKFEARTRKAGLHLWYDVCFDENAGLTKAAGELSSVDGVQMVEYRPKVVRFTSELVPESVSSSVPVEAGSTSIDIFNDPFLATEQWHYYNDGTFMNTIAGADIDVLPAWEQGIVGDDDIIVAIVDGGIDFRHEDLADNMWCNPEVSDPDLSHGYNFERGSYVLTTDEHGTHVAGTVAAVNNNGIGVSGVAGGDKARGIPGARLMSCQIFEGGSGGTSGANAIKWSADHGAVISQNSWGYSPDSYLPGTPASDKAAIDYFVEYAGYDENGVQTGPMAGGIVFFAGGNESVNFSYPSDYENCIAVSAIDGDYEPSSYNNFGDWVDVMAPGGDRPKGHLIYSTLPDNEYGGMYGTSMACPHVSGMAALLIARFGGPGFTSSQLRKMIEGSVRDLSEYQNPQKYIGKGLVDVGAALSMASTEAPDPVTEFVAEGRSNFIDFSFSVPADPDDVVPAYVTLHYSTSPFDVADSIAVNGLPAYHVTLEDVEVNETVSATLGGLDFDTRYYLSISASDFAGNRSPLHSLVEATTGSNSAPVLEPGDDMDVTLRYLDTLVIEVAANDPDGHSISAHITDIDGVSATVMDGNVIRIVLNGTEMTTDEGTVELTVDDGFGGRDSMKIRYTVIRNMPPEIVPDESLPLQIVADMNSSEGTAIDLSQYIMDRDGDELKYVADFSAEGIVSAEFSGNTMTLHPVAGGSVRMVLTASDPDGESVSLTFDVLAWDSERVADFYPNPVVDVLNIRTGDDILRASVEIRDMFGGVKLSEDDLSMSAFEPARIDMSSFPGGLYKVYLKCTMHNGASKSVETTVSKL